MNEAGEQPPAAGQAARPEAEIRFPRLIPLRIYELTHRVLEHAVHAELGTLVGINLRESVDTCGLIVDQCVALADCMLSCRLSSPWPPAEDELRLVVAATTAGLASSGEAIAHTGPPAATRDAVYAYLARVVVDGEPAPLVFPPGESFILPVWTTAAMLVSNATNHTWQRHLELIWELETEDGVNYSALVANGSRSRRRRVRFVPEPE
jgi:hypothetical protein